ncbi:LLM class flavin-dependent oxidoreductase [Nonomuraea sp. NPDC049480]|uniref:LLM class flavin-dependent oxidoreductase n=1 Tax=Nonomuraea sp. NPDC049480 TaxID=3364353 RepID=UPI0037BD0D6D
MTQESEPAGRGVKVGVVLPRPPDEPGEWLTDAVAFEAAGADALWVEHGAAPSLDPLTLTAALAAMTYRSLLAVAVPQTPAPQALATVQRLSRGRLALIVDAGSDEGRVGAGDEAGSDGVGTVVRLAGGGAYEEAGAGRWAPVAVPLGRPAWRETLRLAAERGDQGVLVPADPRLIDLLRNPDDPGGRHDLQLAQG